MFQHLFRFLVIVDSNLRDRTAFLLADPYLRQYKPVFDGVRGRKSSHLRGLIAKASAFTHAYVIVADNDALSLDMRKFCKIVLTSKAQSGPLKSSSWAI